MKSTDWANLRPDGSKHLKYMPYRSGRVSVTDREHPRLGQEGTVVSLVPSLDGATIQAVGVVFGDGPTEYFRRGQLREEK